MCHKACFLGTQTVDRNVTEYKMVTLRKCLRGILGCLTSNPEYKPQLCLLQCHTILHGISFILNNLICEDEHKNNIKYEDT